MLSREPLQKLPRRCWRRRENLGGRTCFRLWPRDHHQASGRRIRSCRAIPSPRLMPGYT